MQSFRIQLQRRNLWDSATIIITADHWFRLPLPSQGSETAQFIHGFEHRWDTRDHRVPFFIKLPNQHTSQEVDQPFNTIVLRNLLAALRSGRIDTPDKIAPWLGQNTPYGESPTTLSLP